MKPVCALNNLVTQSQQHLGIQKQGSFPFEDAEVDFTDLKLISEKKKKVPASLGLHLLGLGRGTSH